MSGLNIGDLWAILRLKDELTPAVQTASAGASTSLGQVATAAAAVNTSVAQMQQQLQVKLAAATQNVKDVEAAMKTYATSSGQALPVLQQELDKAKAAEQALKDELQKLPAAATAATQAVTNHGKAAKDAAKEVKEADKALQQWSAAAHSVGLGLTAAVTLPIVGAGVASTKFASDFEANTLRISTLSNITVDEMKQIRQQVMDLAPAVGIGPNELAKGMLAVTSTGLKGAVAMDVLTASAKASAVGLGQTDEIARTVTAVIQAYGSENISAARATEIMFKAVKDGNVEASEMAGTFGRVIGIASQLGIQFDQVGAYVATFTRLGVNSAEAVTALRGTISAMIKPGKEAKEALADVGLSFEQLRAEIKEKGLTDAMLHLLSAFKGQEDKLAAVIPNVRALAGVMGTAGAQAESYREIQKHLTADTNEMNQAFELTAETAQFKLKQFWAEVEVLAVKVGERLMPALKELLNNAQPILDFLAKCVDWFAQLPDGVQTFAIAVIALGAAGGPVLMALGSVAGAIKNIQILLFGANVAASTSVVGVLGKVGTFLGGAAGLIGGAAALTGVGLVAGSAIETASENHPIASAGLAAVEAGLDPGGNPGVRTGDIHLPRGDIQLMKEVAAFVGPVQEAAKGAVTFAEKLAALTDEQKKTIQSMHAMGASAKVIAHETNISSDVVSAFLKTHKDGKAHLTAYEKALEEYNSIGQSVRDTVAQMSDATVEGLRYDIQRGATQETLQQIYGVTAAQVKAVIAVMKEEADTTKTLDAMHKETQALDRERQKAQLAAMKEVNRAVVENLKTELEFRQQHEDAIVKKATSSFDYQRYEIVRWMGDEKSKLIARGGDWSRAWTEIQTVAKDKMDAVTQSQQEAFARMKAQERTWSNGFQDILAGIPQLLQNAFTGGGGLSGMGKALTSSVGALAGEHLITGPLTGLFNKAAPQLLNTFGSTLTSVIGGAVPFIGPAIGALAGPLLGGLKKLFTSAESEINPIREKFVQDHGGLAALNKAAQEAGVSLTAMLNAKNAEQYKRAIDDITAALDGQKQDTADLKAAIQEYGFTIDELGPTMRRQQLTEQAMSLANQWRLLIGSGIDIEVVTGRMSEKLNAYIQDAIRTGTEVPKEMKPILEQMVKQGTLIDESGNKITDLGESGITFAETMTQGFDRIVSKLGELIDKLTGTTKALDGLPTRRDIEVVTHYRSEGDAPITMHTGGIVGEGMAAANVLQFPAIVAHSGLAPDEVPAVLQTGEAVLNRRATAAIGSNTIRAWNAGQTGGTVVDFAEMKSNMDALKAEVRGLRSDMAQRIPQAITNGFRDAVTRTSGRR